MKYSLLTSLGTLIESASVVISDSVRAKIHLNEFMNLSLHGMRGECIYNY